MAIFDHTHPNIIINLKVSFLEFVPACKKSVTFICSFWRPDWQHPFLPLPNQKLFNQLLIFVNLYHHAKNDAASSIFSGEMVDLKILELDWLRPFWHLSQLQDFSKYRICAKTQQIKLILIIEHNQ